MNLDLPPIAIGTFLLFAMGAGRIIYSEIIYSFPYSNYLNFSNILNFVLNDLFSLAIPIFLLLGLFVFEKPINDLSLNFINKYSFAPWVLRILWVILSVFFLRNHYYRPKQPNNDRDFLFSILYFIAVILLGGFIAKNFLWGMSINSNLLAFSMVSVFIVGFLKMNIDYQKSEIFKFKRKASIQFKDENKPELQIGDPTKRTIVFSTLDIVCVYDDDTNETTVYPMSEISSIKFVDLMKSQKWLKWRRKVKA